MNITIRHRDDIEEENLQSENGKYPEISLMEKANLQLEVLLDIRALLIALLNRQEDKED